MKKILTLLLLLSFICIPSNAQNVLEPLTDLLKNWAESIVTRFAPHYDYEVYDYNSSTDTIIIDNKCYKTESLKKEKIVIKDLAKIDFKKGQWLKVRRKNDVRFKFEIGYDRFHPNSRMTIQTIYDFLDKGNSSYCYTKGKGVNKNVVLDNPILFEEVDTSYKRTSIALIIGNANYKDSISNWDDIPNAVEDAYSVAKELRTLGFETYVKIDVNKDSLLLYFDALKNTAVNRKCEIALFYFSGHGIEDNRGVDYIIPVHPPKDSVEFYIPTDSIKYYIYEGQEKYLPKNRWIFLDACRDEDKKLEGTRKCDTNRPENVIVMHSTHAGKKANFYANPDDAISPFAKAFINSIDSCNIKMANVLGLIRNEVNKETKGKNNGVFEQDPEVVVGDKSDYILIPQSQDEPHRNSNCMDTIPSRSYLGSDISVSSLIDKTVGVGAHFGMYFGKEGFWKNVFGEIGSTINYLNPDELYLYNSSEALTPSESFKYHFRWDLFARLGYHWLKEYKYSFALYGELSHDYFLSTYSKGDFNVLDPSINAKFVWKPKKWWSYYISGGLGRPEGKGDNYNIVKDIINLKTLDFRIQIGANYRFNNKVKK